VIRYSLFDLYLRLEAENAEYATSNAEENEWVKGIEPPHLERRAIRVSGRSTLLSTPMAVSVRSRRSRTTGL
jgi:hypothetical protein